jgi:hypothetical protein
MRLLKAFALLASAASAAQDATQLNNAPVVQNVPGLFAIVDMPSGGSQNIKAEIYAGSALDGLGVVMTVNINGGDPLSGGPFSML